MREALLSIVLLAICAVPCRAMAQAAAAQGKTAAPLAQDATPAAAFALNAVTELKRALTGAWVGTLEYRDYSEPVGSTKRVKLPTWLTVEMAGGALLFRYVYDDGPKKTVTETAVVRIDGAAATYESGPETGKVEESYAIEGLGALKQGHGVLILTGSGTENKAAVAVRTTLRIGRNILEITRETGAAGQPLTFRHTYTFVRAVAPVVANFVDDEAE